MSNKNAIQAITGKDFRTSDLYFAAYLQVAGATLQRTDREPGGKVFFVFDNTVVSIEELRTAWFNQTGRVAALPYANSVRTLKSLCHMI
jgi:hypothetical protein